MFYFLSYNECIKLNSNKANKQSTDYFSLINGVTATTTRTTHAFYQNRRINQYGTTGVLIFTVLHGNWFRNSTIIPLEYINSTGANVSVLYIANGVVHYVDFYYNTAETYNLEADINNGALLFMQVLYNS